MAGDAFVLVPQTAAVADPLAKKIDNEAVDYGGGDLRHRQRIAFPGPDGAAVARVDNTGLNATLAAANTGRRGLVVFNDSTEILYVKYGVTASAADFTHKLLPGEERALPEPCYRGRVDGIWSADDAGGAQVTELTT